MGKPIKRSTSYDNRNSSRMPDNYNVRSPSEAGSSGSSSGKSPANATSPSSDGSKSPAMSKSGSSSRQDENKS